MEKQEQATTSEQPVPWADVPLRLAVVNAMVEALETYLADDALERTVTVETEQGSHSVRMTGGNLLTALHSLQGLREDMLLERKTILDGIRAHFDGLQPDLRPAFHAKLNREVQVRLDQLQAFLEYCAHNRTGCADNYAAAMHDRQIMEEIRNTLADDLADEAAQRLATVDQRLRSLTTEANFVWDDHLQALYPAKTYWYLYRLPPA